MPLVLVAFILLLPLIVIALLPLTIVQRYRVGTARRIGRPWFARLNLLLLAFSTALFVISSAVMNTWVPNALLHVAGGLAAGGLLGLLGLKWTRWEPTAAAIHYTPNRPLVLLLTVAVAARLIYGFWRGWQAWGNSGSASSWLVASGVAGSLGVGAVILGYYLTYWAGVSRRLRRHRSANAEYRATRRRFR